MVPVNLHSSRLFLWTATMARVVRATGAVFIYTPKCINRRIYLFWGRVSWYTTLRAPHWNMANCGEEYIPGNDHVGFNWISRKHWIRLIGRTDEGAKHPVTHRSHLIVSSHHFGGRYIVSWGLQSICPRVDPPHIRPKPGRSAPTPHRPRYNATNSSTEPIAVDLLLQFSDIHSFRVNRQTWFPHFPFYWLYWSLSTLPAPRKTQSFN